MSTFHYFNKVAVECVLALDDDQGFQLMLIHSKHQEKSIGKQESTHVQSEVYPSLFVGLVFGLK